METSTQLYEKRNPRFYDISWFLDRHVAGQLNLDPPYQRKSVWTSADRRFFIDTIMNGYPSPPIFLHRTRSEQGGATYHVVDGKQRLQAIIDFTRNKIRIPDNFSDINLQNKRWNDLSEQDKQRFWDYEIVVEMLPTVSDTFVRGIFDRINRNARKLSRQELRHAKFDGWFISTAQAEAEKEDWVRLGVVTTGRAKRMLDVQFISELMAVTILKALQDFEQDALDDLYAGYDDLADQATFVEEEFRETFERTKNSILRLLELEPDLLKYLRVQAHFYTLWGYLTLQGSDQLFSEAFVARYRQFLDAVATLLADPLFATKFNDLEGETPLATELQYALNTRGATTDLGPRFARHTALVAAMNRTEITGDEGQ